MSNVHEFPGERNIKQRLDDLRDELEDLYDTLNRGYELMDRLETKVAEREQWYNEVLERYTNAIGMDNVPVGYLEYATKNVSIDLQGTEITFKWEPEEEDE
jgi:exonuclease VII small subunit